MIAIQEHKIDSINIYNYRAFVLKINTIKPLKPWYVTFKVARQYADAAAETLVLLTIWHVPGAIHYDGVRFLIHYSAFLLERTANSWARDSSDVKH